MSLYRALFLPFVAALSLAEPGNAQTLGDLLRDHFPGTPPPPESLGNHPLRHYVVSRSRHVVHVAFSTGTTPHAAVHLITLLSNSTRWTHSVVSTGLPQGTRPLRITPATLNTWLDTADSLRHTLILLDSSQTVTVALNGWSELLLPNGAMIYQRNPEPHSTALPVQLRIYDPLERRDAILYPDFSTDSLRALMRQWRDSLTAAGVSSATHNAAMMASEHRSSITNLMADTLASRIAFLLTLGDEGATRATPQIVDLAVVCDKVQSAAPVCSARPTLLLGAAPGTPTDSLLAALLRRTQR